MDWSQVGLLLKFYFSALTHKLLTQSDKYYKAGIDFHNVHTCAAVVQSLVVAQYYLNFKYVHNITLRLHLQPSCFHFSL